jgi:hypothetical protein
MALRKWQKIVLAALVVVLVLVVAGYQVVETSIVEFYSPEWHSDSSAEAQARGILVKRVVAVPRTIPWDSTTLHVADAWIEHRTHVEYAFFLFRREVLDSGFASSSA